MGETDFFSNKMAVAMDFAQHIILEAPRFKDFAIAMADYMGEDFIPYIKSAYSSIAFLPNISVHLDERSEYEKYSVSEIRSWYSLFVAQRNEEKRIREFQENIDELQFLVKSYRSSEEFRKLLDFVGRFSYIAPYNAMLVQMQKPGATFVFTGKKWFEYGRRPKINAQKLIVLKPFGPVQCVFDYGDTEPDPDAERTLTNSDLMEIWDKGLMQAKGAVPAEQMTNLYYNLPMYGIYLDDSFNAANTYGGYVMPYPDATLSIPVHKQGCLRVKSKFAISVNKNEDDVVRFHTICHELGHLFCNHLSYDNAKKRTLSIKEREFEAETVAWLVCKRCGVSNPSEEYLSLYAPDGEIPVCSTEAIMKAVTEIEKMLSKKMKITDTLWYKEDKSFKNSVSDFIKTEKTPRKDLFGNIH